MICRRDFVGGRRKLIGIVGPGQIRCHSLLLPLGLQIQYTPFDYSRNLLHPRPPLAAVHYYLEKIYIYNY